MSWSHRVPVVLEASQLQAKVQPSKAPTTVPAELGSVPIT